MTEQHLIDQIKQERVAHAVVVLSEVRSSTGTPQFRRGVHLSLHSAQRAAERAQERGLETRLILCRLEPVEDEGGSDVLDEAG